MAAHITRNSLLAAAILVIGACATENPYSTSRSTQTTPTEAARLLDCNSEEVAVCVGTNCELEDYYCTNRGDVRDLLKVGDFRH